MCECHSRNGPGIHQGAMQLNWWTLNAYGCSLPQACRREGVEVVVAPYEADSQLAYLSKENIVDFVITEDSDLLAFGCKQVSHPIYQEITILAIS